MKAFAWYTFYYYLSLLSRDLTNYLLLLPYFYVVLCDHTALFSFFEVHLSAWYCMKYYLGGGCMFLFLFSYETANNNNGKK